MSTTITMDVRRLPVRTIETLGHILACYGAHFITVRPGTLTIIIASQLIDNFVATVQRDVLPVAVNAA